jgi:hypothetical protein
VSFHEKIIAFDDLIVVYLIVPKEKIEKLWHQFTKYDREGTGYMV